MTSDSSDEENLDQLKEAQDALFINDSMFDDSPKKHTEDNQIKTLPSLRNSRNDEDQFNFLKVTPEFRHYVGKQLSKILDRKLEKKFADFDSPEGRRKKRKKGGVKLLSESEDFLELSVAEDKDNAAHNAKAKRAKKNKKTDTEITEELLQEVTVSPDHILSKKEVKHWSKRSKAAVFRYKKSKNGQLQLVEPEFK